MVNNSVPRFALGNFEVRYPIIQGGMGVRVSKANLASAVANSGGVGIISGLGLGPFENLPGADYITANDEALRCEIRKARRMTTGVLGVNIMMVASNAAELIKVCVQEDVDLIICGAGLPLDVPRYLNGRDISLLPIVSSVRALHLICKTWQKRFGILPDGVIVEGVRAGGHLGFSFDNIKNGTSPQLEEIVGDIVEFVQTCDPEIPVIAAGGIWDGKDIARFLKLGCSGVQMATRFVCTKECDIDETIKQAYIKASKEDIVVIKSPVGMPIRVLKNPFVELIEQGKTVPFKCSYRCLRACDPKKVPYCICRVLAKASMGNLTDAFVCAGANAYRCTEIVSVETLISRLMAETQEELDRLCT